MKPLNKLEINVSFLYKWSCLDVPIWRTCEDALTRYMLCKFPIRRNQCNTNLGIALSPTCVGTNHFHHEGNQSY